MVFKTPSIKIFVLLGCFLFIVSYSSAQSDSSSLSVQTFIQDGLKAYERHDILRAVDHFSRALLLDSTDKTAREHLTLINAQEHLPARHKAQLFLTEDLFSFTDSLKKKAEYFTVKCQTLESELLKQGYARAYIKDQLLGIKERFFHPLESPPTQGDLQDPLEAVNASLGFEKEWLSHELFYRQRQYAWLQELNRRAPFILSIEIIAEGEGPTDFVPLLPDIEKEDEIAVKAILQPQETSFSDVSPAGPYQQIALLQQELEQLRQEFNGLKKYVQEKDQKLADLTGQVIDFSLKLAEKEMILSEKIDALTRLDKAYDDLQSRFDLGHKIIQEKNTQIQSLRDSLEALQLETSARSNEFSERITSQTARLDELEGILRIYSGKLGDAARLMSVKDKGISALEEQLTLMHTKLFEKETALEKMQQKLADLEKRLDGAQGQWLKTKKEALEGSNRRFVFSSDVGFSRMRPPALGKNPQDSPY